MIIHSEETQKLNRENIPPFDEMIISWNGERPEVGILDLYVSVQVGEWSPWILYASWGKDVQMSYDFEMNFVKVYQDILQVLGPLKATGFQIKADCPMRFHVYTNGDPLPQYSLSYRPVYLQLKGLSQMVLNHPRYKDLCSPTSTTAVIRYLCKKAIDPILFAERARDQKFDIFGNWVLNVAECSTYLGPFWNVWVEKLKGFQDIYQRLCLGTPVITSIRGPLPGSADPYTKGHLLVVTGFDPEAREVECMDPAFKSNEETHVRYPFDDFLAAWARRENIAYIFEKREVEGN